MKVLFLSLFLIFTQCHKKSLDLGNKGYSANDPKLAEGINTETVTVSNTFTNTQIKPTQSTMPTNTETSVSSTVSMTTNASISTDVFPSSAQKHLLDVLNSYRSQFKVGPLEIDKVLSDYALIGSQVLSQNGIPHDHIRNDPNPFEHGFCSNLGENQAPAWEHIKTDVNKYIDEVTKAMMDEGPGGGHYENIINPKFSRVGIALLPTAMGFYYTTDFSGSCYHWSYE